MLSPSEAHYLTLRNQVELQTYMFKQSHPPHHLLICAILGGEDDVVMQGKMSGGHGAVRVTPLPGLNRVMPLIRWLTPPANIWRPAGPGIGRTLIRGSQRFPCSPEALPEVASRSYNKSFRLMSGAKSPRPASIQPQDAVEAVVVRGQDIDLGGRAFHGRDILAER